MKKHSNKKINFLLIITLIVVEIISLFLTVKSFLNKNNSIDKINTDYNSGEMFAILVENDNGEYIESTALSWPSNDTYSYNASRSVCINSKGETIENALTFNRSSNEARIKTQEAVYCYLYFDKIKPFTGDAYALYTEDNQTLTFVRSETPYEVGGTYNDQTITNVYTGFEEETYAYNTVPWYNERAKITNITFVDEIKPTSTAVWFGCMTINSIDIFNLNIANVTDIGGMFFESVINAKLDIENWDTTNVTIMTDVFDRATLNVDLDLSGWDVSNVIDHSYFSPAAGTGTFIEPNWLN